MIDWWNFYICFLLFAKTAIAQDPTVEYVYFSAVTQMLWHHSWGPELGSQGLKDVVVAQSQNYFARSASLVRLLWLGALGRMSLDCTSVQSWAHAAIVASIWHRLSNYRYILCLNSIVTTKSKHLSFFSSSKKPCNKVNQLLQPSRAEESEI